tara:strand:- start:409 stop:798 length:390 start_codon:yes stop_codon:yes gene_type:complete
MSVDKVYSHNEEDWVEELQEAIDAAIEQQDCQPECVNIKIGDKVLVTHSKLSSDVGGSVVVQIQECAYDEGGEWADQYLDDLDKDKIDELSRVIADWIEKNAEEPNFYTVENIKDFECAADIALSFEDN